MNRRTALEIIQPATDEEYHQVHELIRAFLRLHQQRHEGTTLTRDYYGNAEFEQELASLPEKYGIGRNCLLFARNDSYPAGCIALHELDKETCEMKRMYVEEAYQGKGIGRVLAQEIIGRAKNLGYTVMKLNTGICQTEAQKLYESLGFKSIAPYYALPNGMKDLLVFMELKL